MEFRKEIHSIIFQHFYRNRYFPFSQRSKVIASNGAQQFLDVISFVVSSTFLLIVIACSKAKNF